MKYKPKVQEIEAEQWYPDHPVKGVIYPVPDDGANIKFHELHGECGLYIGYGTEIEPGDYSNYR